MRAVATVVVLFCAAFAAFDPCPAREPDLPFYVGRDVCVACHAATGKAPVCAVEPIPAHEVSYEILTDPRAPDIAALSGVPESPQESRVCLGCHATSSDAGPRWTRETFRLADGVQCEGCHDAGSLHVESIRAGTDSPSTGSDLIRRADRSICDTCHMERTSHDEVLRRGFRRSAADRLYRTPVNLAISRDGDELYVVCQQSNSLIVLDPGSGEVLDEIAVGRRPHDVAVHPSGRTLYVSNRHDNSLSVIDVESRRVVAEIAVGEDPHGVMTDRTGRLVFVLNTAQDSISVVDTTTLKEIKRTVAGRGPWSADRGPKGELFFATNVMPTPARFLDPPRSEITVASLESGAAVRRVTIPGANMLQGIAVTPDDVAIFTLMRTKNLVPVTRLAQGWVITNGLGIVWPDGRVGQVLLDEPAAGFPDPTAIAVSPDGRHALIASGGADEVAVVDVAALLLLVSEASPREREEILPNHLGMSERFVVARVPVGANPRDVLFSPDGRTAYVANALDDSVTVLDTADFTVAREISLGGPGEETEIRRGEKLFHSAANVVYRQFSCRSCHPDGHTNGLTFDIEADGIGLAPVVTRTLRGILDTPPFKWEGINPTLGRQCGPRFAVFFARQEPYDLPDLEALVRYESTIELPPNRHRRPDGLTPAQRRGKVIFDRRTNNNGEPIPREWWCTSCHWGPYGTSRTKSTVGTTMWFDGTVDMAGLDIHEPEAYGELGVVYYVQSKAWQMEWDAPHLKNVYSHPPYLHNGAAATLEEIFTRFNIYDWHGSTRDLTRRQFNDLIAYLEAF